MEYCNTKKEAIVQLKQIASKEECYSNFIKEVDEEDATSPALTAEQWWDAVQWVSSDSCTYQVDYTLNYNPNTNCDELIIIDVGASGYQVVGAIWDAGCHQMAVYKELTKRNQARTTTGQPFTSIKIPALSTSKTSSNAIDPFLRIPQGNLSGISATTGLEASQKYLCNLLQCRPNQFLKMPRARRPGDKTTWKQVMTTPKQEPTVVYNQRLDTSTKLFDTYTNRDAALVKKLRELVRNEHSVMLFAEDIKEAERIYELLKKNNFEEIQKFTQAGATQTEPAPALPIILERSALNKVITVTTACGGRALNFKAEVGILLSSSFTRHQEQMLGRIARNGNKGTTFAYFAMEDFTFSNNFSFNDWHNLEKITKFLNENKNIKKIVALDNRHDLIHFRKQIELTETPYDPDNLNQSEIEAIKKRCQEEIPSMVLPFLLHLGRLEEEEALKIKRAIDGCKKIPDNYFLKGYESEGEKAIPVVSSFFNQSARPVVEFTPPKPTGILE